MSSYLTLKIFKEYSKVKQWDKSEYWVACRQLIPIVSLLLIKDNPAVPFCVQTIIDFVHMPQYKSHSNKMLRYMQHALYQINQTKEVLKDVWQTDTMNRASKTEHFSFSKSHIMFYYPNWIKLYRTATGFTTGIKEAMHIIWIKDFFKRTNIRKSYEKQILNHNTEKFSLMVRADLDMFTFAKTLSQGDQNAEL